MTRRVCTHHWSIEPPNGPTSRGTCLKCGEVREFRNSPEPRQMRNLRGDQNERAHAAAARVRAARVARGESKQRKARR